MERLELNHYRCFEHLELSFAPGVNLLIGDNASGKTSLVRAMTSVLSSFFAGYSDENTRFIGLRKDDFRIVETETGLANEEEIVVNFNFLERTASMQLISKKSRTLHTPLEAIASLGHEMEERLFKEGKQALALPLFASFSTSDIHSIRKLSMEKFKKYKHKPSFGYYECLQGDGFLEYWTNRLLVLREGNADNLEFEGVHKALCDFLGEKGCNVIFDVGVWPRQGTITYFLMDGRVTDTSNLSDGLRRLVNIGMDLAFRCMLLNQGIYGIEACKKTEGTVVIDEIDLHLHPSLQALVVQGLQNAFPKLQFIITSHAPMVMSSIPNDENHKIIQLGYSKAEGYTAKTIGTYGMDSNTIIETVLGLVPRAKAVDDELNVLLELIDNDDYPAAKTKLESMRAVFGDTLPDLVRAETMLNFLPTTKKMIQINKGKEPAAWTAKCATPGFTKYAPIQELRDALIAEQFAICAFCMRRIPTKDQWRTEESLASGAGLDGTERETSKIAHLQSRSRHPELQLKYWNMVAACPGMINGDAHCDKSQESDDVTLPLFKPSLQAAISYRTKDGEIKCAEPQWHQEMTEILKLNNALLKKCRWEVIEGVRRQIEAKKWKTTQLETILKEWENPDKEGKLKPFCGVVVWYLRKKLHQA